MAKNCQQLAKNGENGQNGDKILIKVEHLTFDYPDKRALNEIHFELIPNTITALVGPNGAGKSTLMRCMAALDFPAQGRVWLNNLNVFEDPRKAHTFIGYLPDTYGLYEDLTVYQCLKYQAMAHKLSADIQEERIQEAAKSLQIEEFLQTETGTLSKGQKQRVAIAQTLIHHPKILLLDEPASNLDPEARYHLSEVFKNLQALGTTLLVSSHILSELEDYCTHMIVLREGKLMNYCDLSQSSMSMMELYMESGSRS